MSKFAVFETGGKQYRVAVGDTLKIEKLSQDYKKGDAIVFENVLMLDSGKESKVGTPYLKGVKVTAHLEEEGLSNKVNVIRYKSKSRYFKKKGHRQPFMKISIKQIS